MDASADDLSVIRQVCKANVAQRLRKVARAAQAARAAARSHANRTTANVAESVAARAPKRDWDAPSLPLFPINTPSSPPAQPRLFTKTIASPGRLPSECSEVVFQGVRSPHIFVVQSDDSDDEDLLRGNDSLPIPVSRRVELQIRGSPHVHNIL